jgi:uncharacterized repeat protein (TIGR02543 family)
MCLIGSKNIKTFLSILMVLAMLACLILTTPVAALAESTAPVLAAGSASGNAGDTVTVPVTLTNESSAVGIQFELTFDASQLSYVRTTRGPLINILNNADEQVYQFDANLITDGSGSRVRVMVHSSTNTLIPSGSGILVNLQFTVVAPIQGGQITTLGLSGVTFSDVAGAVIAATLTGGQFTIPLINYTVSFEENGGTAVDDITQASGSTINTAPASTRAGHVLEGWYSDAELTHKVTFPYTITGSVTLYANWTEGGKAAGGDIANAVFYIAVQDTTGGNVNYYYFTRSELETYETQQSYTYNDHSVIKTVTCKGALVKNLLDNLNGVNITSDMVVQYAEQDAYHADPHHCRDGNKLHLYGFGCQVCPGTGCVGQHRSLRIFQADVLPL